MESFSEALHCGGSPWKSLLITASLLSCWIQPTSSQSLKVVPNPPYGRLGNDVTLDIKGFSGDAFTYTWYKKLILESNKIAYLTTATQKQLPPNIREKILQNGSLYLPNVTFSDTNYYIVLIVDKSSGTTLHAGGRLEVYDTLYKPNLFANGTLMIENDTLTLMCNTPQRGMDVIWFFRSKPLIPNERMTFTKERLTLVIHIKRHDSGTYLCEIRNPISFNRSESHTLTVYYGPDPVRFLPNPEGGEIEVLFQNILNLLCFAESFPTAHYEWKINDSSIPGFHSNTFIKNVSLEDSGKYTCLAKNDVTKLTVSKDIIIKVLEIAPQPSLSNLKIGAGIAAGVFAGVVLIACLVYVTFFRRPRRAASTTSAVF